VLIERLHRALADEMSWDMTDPKDTRKDHAREVEGENDEEEEDKITAADINSLSLKGLKTHLCNMELRWTGKPCCARG